MQLETISDTVHRLILPDQEIILVGTAHVSQNSVDEGHQGRKRFLPPGKHCPCILPAQDGCPDRH